MARAGANLAQTDKAQESPTESAQTRRRWPKWLSGVVAALLIFGVGFLAGQGKLSWTSFDTGLQSQNSDLPAELDMSSVQQVYDSLRQNYDGKMTQTELLDGLKHGLASSLGDPYTVYFTAKEASQFQDNLNNTFSGIGAELSQDEQGNLIVQSPLSGYPAEKAGLKARDIIASVNGKSTDGWSVSQAAQAIRGKAGTQVKLKIVRDHKTELDFTITRQNITIPSVSHKILKGSAGQPIGYIQIVSFSDDTANLVQQAANKLASKHVKGVILDLRNNPGGELGAAVTTASQWLPDGKLILQEKRGSTVIDSYTSQGNHPLQGIPTVVLINGGSASAAEITAAALHDNGAAYLMGSKSFGKGVVQQLVNFRDGSQLKVTVAKWYRPNGGNINHNGIEPDKAVKQTSQTVDQPRQAAIDYLSGH